MEGISIKIRNHHEELDLDKPVSMHRLKGPLGKFLGCSVMEAR